MNPYVAAGFLAFCVVLNLVNGLLIATISGGWGCND